MIHTTPVRTAALLFTAFGLTACELPPPTPIPIVAVQPQAPAPAPVTTPTGAPVAAARPPAFTPSPGTVTAAPRTVASPIEVAAPTGFNALFEDPDLELAGGYRDPNDPCQRAVPNRLTQRYMGDGVDLVGCLTGGGAGRSLVAQTGAQPVARTASYTLYRVPRR